MSYLCFVPKGAVEKEHMTLVWMGKAWDSPEAKEAFAHKAVQLTDLHCPFDGVVFDHAEFRGKRVALLVIPHLIHVVRYHYRGYDHSGRGSLDWNPHITAVRQLRVNTETFLRPIGQRITFTKAEFRP